ncbi:MAG: hypothetical protein ACI8ZM_003541 [Crocinitomix sp.]|jgi:hypothetical protein
MNLLVYTFAIIILLVSCKKPEERCEKKGYEVFETSKDEGIIASNEYIAAYPGSWWTFSNGNNLTCELISISGVELINADYKDCQKFNQRVSMMVPQISGRYTPHSKTGIIYDDKQLYDADPFAYSVKQVSITYGDKWPESTSNPDNPIPVEADNYVASRSVQAILDSVALPNDDVFYDIIIIRQFHEYSDSKFTWGYSTYLYYAREIGLIWINQPYSPVIGYEYSRYLTDYYIAPH